MALNPSKLARQILSVFDSKPASFAVAARGIASAYEDYALSASAGGLAGPVLTGQEAAVLRSSLLNSIRNLEGASPAKLGRVFGNAIETFWMSPAVAFLGGSYTGTTYQFAGLPGLISGLTGVFSNLNGSSGKQASSIASELHTATTVVMVELIPPPPASPVYVLLE